MNLNQDFYKKFPRRNTSENIVTTSLMERFCENTFITSFAALQNDSKKNRPAFILHIRPKMNKLKTFTKVYKDLAELRINPFSTNFTKWSNTLNQFLGNLPTNCLSVFHHFVGLVLKGWIRIFIQLLYKRCYEPLRSFHKTFSDFTNKNKDFTSIVTLLTLPVPFPDEEIKLT